MKLYIAGRHRGKTTKLVEFARKHGCAIIVPSFNAANNLLRYMTHNYISNVPVFSIDEIISMSDGDSPLIKLRGRKIGGVVVDDVQLCIKVVISRFTGIDTKAVSMNINCPAMIEAVDGFDEDDHS